MRTRRSPFRWLAPLALIVVVGTALVVVNNSDVRSGSEDKTSSQGITGSTTTETTAPKHKGRRFYVVKPGDTLSAIAEATGVPLERILELNPGIDEQTLNAGQKIKLR
jgi:LysM repeat protein